VRSIDFINNTLALQKNLNLICPIHKGKVLQFHLCIVFVPLVLFCLFVPISCIVPISYVSLQYVLGYVYSCSLFYLLILIFQKSNQSHLIGDRS
jgi:hypothetical protein